MFVVCLFVVLLFWWVLRVDCICVLLSVLLFVGVLCVVDVWCSLLDVGCAVCCLRCVVVCVLFVV